MIDQVRQRDRLLFFPFDGVDPFLQCPGRWPHWRSSGSDPCTARWCARCSCRYVTSIVGRFLEHGRIYRFGRGKDTKLYIASADLMTRNLNHRVEIACPVYDLAVKEQLLRILHTQLEDNVKASSLLPDGSYCRKVNTLAPC